MSAYFLARITIHDPREYERYLGACRRNGKARAQGACEPQARREEAGDVPPSAPTSNAACGRNPPAPFGLRRRGAICGVAAPRRWRSIAFGAAPGISPHVASNAGSSAFSDRLLEGFDAVFAGYRGEVLAVDDAPLVLEGSWPCTRTVLIRFVDLAEARRWYLSPAYQELARVRQRASTADIVLIEGAG